MSYTVVVVPCYNEAGRLDPEAFARFSVEGEKIEFAFVDDGSTDSTPSILSELSSRSVHCWTVRLPQNVGKAEAVRLGVVEALARKPDFIAYWDADLATPLAEIGSFLRLAQADHKQQVIMGSRVKLLGRDIQRRPLRHYLGRVGATLISLTLGVAVYDTQCGAKLFRNDDDLAAVFDKPFMSRWIFDVEILARYEQRLGKAALSRIVSEVPLTQWHDVGGSNLRSGDFIRALGDLRRIRKAYR